LFSASPPHEKRRERISVARGEMRMAGLQV
jgi:hypothetical protein